MVESTTPFGGGLRSDRDRSGGRSSNWRGEEHEFASTTTASTTARHSAFSFGRSSWHGIAGVRRTCVVANELTTHCRPDLIELLAHYFGPLVGPQTAHGFRGCRRPADGSAIPLPVLPPRCAPKVGAPHTSNAMPKSATRDALEQQTNGSSAIQYGNALDGACPLDQLGNGTSHLPRLDVPETDGL